VSRRDPAPAIYFLSDYGTADEFVGVVHAVLHRRAPGVPVIDLSHRIPPYDVAAGSAMLARCAPDLGAGVVLAVVDPGVGTDRRAVAVRVGGGGTDPAVPTAARPTWLVGPDNGLLAEAVAVLGGATGAIELGPVRPAPPGGPGPQRVAGRGPTFDGRDVLAPAAAHLALGGDPHLLGAPVDPLALVTEPAGRSLPEVRLLSTPGGTEVVTTVTAVDRFGNVQLALATRILDEVGLRPGGTAEVAVVHGPGRAVPVRRVVAFAELAEGELGLLIDSSGWPALVFDRASAAQALGLG
jgi:S-adenosylmethionine hydrolase